MEPFAADLAALHVLGVDVASPDVGRAPVALAVPAVVASRHVLTKRLGALESSFQAFGTRSLEKRLIHLRLNEIKVK